MEKQNIINVSKSFLPEKKEYDYYLDRLWKSNWLTNNGEILLSLEDRLKEKLGSTHLVSVNNGTTALQLAIEALNLKNEVITTPFSYVATISSLVWQRCEPIFCDIDPKTLNINHEKIEELITENTSAILATHVYGNPCQVEEISTLASKYNLKVVYDASHCFDVKYKGESILNEGDISTISFHATKIFHTVEGGALITQSDKLSYRLKQLRNFGHKGQESFDGIGINGKQSEFHAAMGHCVLDHFEYIKNQRRIAYNYYMDHLTFHNSKMPEMTKNVDYNYSYFPIIFNNKNDLLYTKSKLEASNIYPRRYFYPSLTVLDYVKKDKDRLFIAEDICQRVLCLPLHHDLRAEDLYSICKIVNQY